jgi:sugar lactone lactonase YvrE
LIRIIVALCALLAAGHALAQSPSCGARLFLSGYFSTVHVFDACTGAYLRDLDTNARIKGPQAVKLGPDGLVYVTSENTQQILRYRNDTLEFVDVFATLPGADPTGFAFAPNGDVYVAAYKTSDVRRLSAAGTPIDIPVPNRAAGLVGPDNGITFGPDGNLYVPGYDSNNVIRHDPRTGATSVAVPSRTQSLGHTRGLLPERDGTGILITGEGSNQLLRFDLATGAVTVKNSKLNQPTGLDFAPDGSLLVLERDQVRKLDPATGNVLGVFIPTGSAHVDFGTYLAVIPFASAPAKATVVEYHHAALDHYFISALPADIAALDSGNLGGWARTGHTFNAYAGAAEGTSPVCRFYLPPASGDSHFYSASPAECAEVAAKFPAFVHESPDVMQIALPDLATGDCPAGLVKVYRLWNNRADSNHRYTTDPAVKAAMVARGYVAEGYGPDATIMCAEA